MSDKNSFDVELIKSYPRSSRKISLEVAPYSIQNNTDALEAKGHTTFISPHGMEFQSQMEYEDGTLLKIQVAIPEYWDLKKKFINYGRIDTPNNFNVLAKVVQSQSIGKRGKKKLVLVQTVNIDEVDEQVLKFYLEEGK